MLHVFGTCAAEPSMVWRRGGLLLPHVAGTFSFWTPYFQLRWPPNSFPTQTTTLASKSKKQWGKLHCACLNLFCFKMSMPQKDISGSIITKICFLELSLHFKPFLTLWRMYIHTFLIRSTSLVRMKGLLSASISARRLWLGIQNLTMPT